MDNVVRARNGRIRLIDFGFSEKIIEIIDQEQCNPNFRGTAGYFPSKQSDTKETLLARIKGLGQVGLDIFALKRLVYYPYFGHRTQLTYQEFNQLSPDLRKLLGTSDPDQTESKATALEITFALIKLEMAKAHPLDLFRSDLTNEEKESICTCFGLLDELNECIDDTTQLSEQQMTTYQRRIMACEREDYTKLQAELIVAKETAMCGALLKKIDDSVQRLGIKPGDYVARLSNPLELNASHQALTAIHKCLSLLVEIKQHAIGGNDEAMNTYITQIDERLNTATLDNLSGIEQDLLRGLDCVESDEMQSVIGEMNRLRTNATNWSTWDKTGMTSKAQKIASALQQVPIEERLNVFTHQSTQCHAVRIALATNRLSNKGAEHDTQGTINDLKAADAFKRLKEKHREIINQSQEDDLNRPSSETDSLPPGQSDY